MKNYNRKDRFDGEKGFRRGGRDSGRSTMHQATCSNCGRDCEVPFKPTGSKPVYCSNCFDKDQNEVPRRSFRGSGDRKFSGRDNRDRGFGERSSGRPPKHVVACDKCGEECEVPFRPTKGKPVYCDKCFEYSGQNKEKGYDLLKKELEAVNKKLDKILKALKPVPAEKEDPVEAVEETEDPKPEEKTKKAAATKTVAKKKAPVEADAELEEEKPEKKTKKMAAPKTTEKKAAPAKKAVPKTAAKKKAPAKKASKK